MKQKLFFMKYSAVMLLLCFLFSQHLFSQTVTKETKKETLTTKGVNNKAVNNPYVKSVHNPNVTATITPKQIVANAKKYNNINKTSTIVLNFEGLGNLAHINNYYNGGGGPNYGVYFNNAALALIDTYSGGSGNTANDPSGFTSMFFLDGNASVMNVTDGFTTGFSFYFCSSADITLYVYDGLDGTGNLLASQTFTASGIAPDWPWFRIWVPAGLNFNGIAKSVSFTGVANQCVFDDVTFGSSTPGQPTAAVPTLSEWGLIILGFVLICMGIYYIRRRSISIS
ncbi:MAG: IPTL-CTERM sorting domain-containing protein [Bacteroidetes bacterium]|nr:IPTL-CTERM sorting domain-containing protein [Bacteroidota bacterium]